MFKVEIDVKRWESPNACNSYKSRDSQGQNQSVFLTIWHCILSAELTTVFRRFCPLDYNNCLQKKNHVRFAKCIEIFNKHCCEKYLYSAGVVILVGSLIPSFKIYDKEPTIRKLMSLLSPVRSWVDGCVLATTLSTPIGSFIWGLWRLFLCVVT